MHVINAVNLASGGGFSILKNIYLHAPLNSIFIVKNKAIKDKLISLREVGPKLYVPGKWINNPAGMLFFYLWWVNDFCVKNKAKKLISLGNISSRTKVYQKLYLHWAYFVSGVNKDNNVKFTIYLKRKFRYIIILLFSKFTNEWIVQTSVMKIKLDKKLGSGKSKVTYIYPGFNHPAALIKCSNYSKSEINLFYPSLYYSHKNFEILIDFFTNENLSENVFISLTLPANIFEELGFTNCPNVRNLGVISHEQVLNEYKEHTALVMPTLLETFGLPYLEAMSLGVPILSSDKDFAREICGDYAFYFDPKSVDELATSIDALKKALENNYDFIKSSEDALSKFPRWKDSVRELFQ